MAVMPEPSSIQSLLTQLACTRSRPGAAEETMVGMALPGARAATETPAVKAETAPVVLACRADRVTVQMVEEEVTGARVPEAVMAVLVGEAAVVKTLPSRTTPVVQQ